MRLAPLLLAAGAIPLISTFATPRPDEPAFGISCGSGISGKPGVVTIEAGPLAPGTIQVVISAAQNRHTSYTSSIQVATPAHSGSCTTDTHSPYRVFLNSSSASTVSLRLDSPDTLRIRGLRGGREISSVTIVPDRWVDARLTW